MSSKVLVIGLDGATEDIVMPMVEKWLRRVTCSWMCKMEGISMHHVFSSNLVFA